jgi:RNA polymerase sigma-70 factor (ECF subfamily)
VPRLRAGDERAFRHLHDRYAARLRAVVWRVLPADDALMEDVLPASWVNIGRGLAGYDAGRSRLYPWMAGVCRNHALDALRSPRHRFNSGTKSLETHAARHAPAPATFNPEHLGVRALTRRLKPRQREVIDRLYFGGCTQAETAEELGIPLATVKTRARAARRVLAQAAR